MNSYVKNLQNEKKQHRSRLSDKAFKWFLGGITILVVFFILFSFASIIIKGIGAGNNSTETSWTEILFGTNFKVPDSFAMGIIILNTVWMSFLVLLIAAPISVATALFVTRVLPKRFGLLMIAVVSILAAIPSVVYGAFGKYFLMRILSELGLSGSQEASLLAIIIVISIMVMPTITLMTITSVSMVDRKLNDSSVALGATHTQTSIYIVLRSAKTGIIIGMLFALGRCLGEATAIAMMSSSTPMSEGVTFSLLEVSLFMSPVIMNAFALQGTYPSYAVVYEVLSALLLIVILMLFLFVKFIENMTDDAENSKKQSKRAVEIHNVNKKISKLGIEELTPEEGRLYAVEYKRQYYEERSMNNESVLRSSEMSVIRSRTSLDESESQVKYKKRQNLTFNLVIIALSMAGIFALLMILGFLFNVDMSLFFNWEYWTLKGRYIDGATGNEYWGIAIPLFGTMATVITSLSIAMPLGIAIAIFVDVYIKKGGILSKIVGFSFQIMTSVPAVIYGTMAIILFSQTDWINSNFVAFKPMFMLAIVILPTIIKQTGEGLRGVKSSQVEGSLALGATNAYTSTRILVMQAMPAILSAAILAISIVMADSAIFITVLQTKPETWVEPTAWLENGGFTLSTNIYWISTSLFKDPAQRVAGLQQIKTTGIILMIFIFWLSIISQKIKSKSNIDATLMTVGLLMFATAPFIIDGGIFVMFIAGAILGLLGIVFEEIKERVLRN